METGIVVFAFGAPSTISTNQELARAILGQAFRDRSVRVVYTQREISVRRGPVYPGQCVVDVEYIGETEGAEPTLRIARWAVERAKQQNLDGLIVIAARPHLWRCVRDVRYAIRENRADIQVKAYRSKNNVWFCPKSTQPRTRSAMAWWPRELLLRCIPMWLYAKIAG